MHSEVAITYLKQYLLSTVHYAVLAVFKLSCLFADIDDIDGDLDLDGGLGGGSLGGRSPSPPQDPTREVVRYNTCRGISGGGLRRQDSDTNPRSLSRNNNNQLFYS